MSATQQIIIRPTSLTSDGFAKVAAWVLCLGLAVMVPMDLIFPGAEESPQVRLIPHAVKLCVLATMLAYILIAGMDLARRGFPMAKPLVLFITLLTAYVLVAQGPAVETLVLYGKHLFWVVAALAAYLLSLNGHLRRQHVVLTASAVIAVASAASIIEGLDDSAPLARNGFAYTLLWCVPLVLLSEHKRLRLLPVLLAAGAILFTFKRGASVALVLSSIVYIVLESRQSAHRGRLIAIGAVLLAVAGAFALWQWESLATRWQDMDSLDTAGSNRGQLYSLVLSHVFQGDLFAVLLGYGFNSVMPYLDQIGYAPVYAHSDVLEILHDQGLVGIAAFLGLHVGFIALLIHAWRARSRFLPALAMGYVIFTCVNFYSGCTMYSETALLSLLVGYVAGAMDRQADDRLPAAREARP